MRHSAQVAIAAVLLLLAGAGGVLAARIVVVLVGIGDWGADTAVTVTVTAATIAATSFVLCQRRVGSAAAAAPAAPAPQPHAVIRRGSLVAGALLSVTLMPFAPDSWAQALPVGAFVALSGGSGVIAARARTRWWRRRRTISRAPG